MKARITTIRSSNITGKMKLSGADICLIPENFEDQIVLEFLNEHNSQVKLILAQEVKGEAQSG